MTKAKITAGIVLGCALFLLYLMIYQGQLLMSDERTLFDSAQSLIRRGEVYPTYEFDLVEARFGGTPWRTAAHEPLPIVVTALFTWIGRVVPEIGMVHTALLSNLLVTALTAVSVYVVGLMLGYSMRSALLVALIFGIGTNIVPYTRTLFREPLTALFTIWLFAFALFTRRDWTATGRIPWHWLILLLIAFAGAVFTKVVVVLFIPGLLIVLMPDIRVFMQYRRYVALVVIAGAIIMIAAVFISRSALVDGTRYDWARWSVYFETINYTSVIESLIGYHVSIGRSIWLYSPILLIGLWGAWLLIKRGEWRIVAAPLVIIPIFSLFYGIVHREVWWGGWGWGPRYFVPLLPVMMLWLLPVMERQLTRWQRLLIGGVVLLGIGMQVLSLTNPLPNYYSERHLSGHAVFNQPEPWMAINWNWELGPIAYHLTETASTDIAWAHVENGGLVVITAFLLVIGSGVMMWRRKSGWVLVSGITLGVMILTAYGVYLLRDDPRYIAGYADVDDLVTQLNTQSRAGEALFIDEPLYTPIFMNYLKTPSLVVTLPYAPGEVFDESGPQVVSDDLRVQAGVNSVYALDWTAGRYDSLWLVASTSPFDPTKIRPIERYLVEHYYPVQEIGTSPRARAVQFFTGVGESAVPFTTINARFGEAIRLSEYNRPLGDTYTPGDMLPLTLLWEVTAPPAQDYNVGLFLLNAAGEVVVQRDGQPQATFGRTSQWTPDTQYRDNHALHLPDSLPSGVYEVGVVVYDWQTQARLTVNDGEDHLSLGTINIER